MAFDRDRQQHLQGFSAGNPTAASCLPADFNVHQLARRCGDRWAGHLRHHAGKVLCQGAGACIAFPSTCLLPVYCILRMCVSNRARHTVSTHHLHILMVVALCRAHLAVRALPHQHAVCRTGSKHGVLAAGSRRTRGAQVPAQRPNHGASTHWRCSGGFVSQMRGHSYQLTRHRTPYRHTRNRPAAVRLLQASCFGLHNTDSSGAVNLGPANCAPIVCHLCCGAHVAAACRVKPATS